MNENDGAREGQNPLSNELSAEIRTGAVSGPSDMDSSYPAPKSSLGKIYPTSLVVAKDGPRSTEDFRIVCAWCKEVMHEGHPTGQDQISHGMCCPCKAKYFPTLEHGSNVECDFLLTDREHESDDRPVGYNYATDSIRYEGQSYHVDHYKCRNCGMEHNPEPEACDCGPDDDGPDRSDE